MLGRYATARTTGGILALMGLALLTACRTLAPITSTPWPERRGALQGLAQFEFTGQLAAATASEGFSASVHWHQAEQASALQLRGPLGAGGAHLDFDGRDLRVTASNGTRLDGEAAHAELVRLLGFEPPLASLRYWLLGVPDPGAPAAETLDTAQRLLQLQQYDWQVDYSDYAAVPASGATLWLPQRLSLHRGALRLRLHVAHWALP